MRRFSKIQIFFCAISIIFHASNPTFAEEISENGAATIERNELIVSTYHTTGIPGSTRLMELSWPSGARRGPSGLPIGQAFGPEQSMGFTIFTGGIEIWLSINAVDKYPLSSMVGTLGGRKNSEIKTHPEGFTYRSHSGYLELPTNLKGWKLIYYEPSWEAGKRNDLWIKNDDDGKVNSILRCKKDGFVKFPKCEFWTKIEPIFVQASFDKIDIDRLDEIEVETRYFAQKLLSGDWNG